MGNFSYVFCCLGLWSRKGLKMISSKFSLLFEMLGAKTCETGINFELTTCWSFFQPLYIYTRFQDYMCNMPFEKLKNFSFRCSSYEICFLKWKCRKNCIKVHYFNWKFFEKFQKAKNLQQYPGLLRVILQIAIVHPGNFSGEGGGRRFQL